MNQSPHPIAIISANEAAPAEAVVIREVGPVQWVIQDLGYTIKLTPAGTLLAQAPTDQSISAPPPTGFVETKIYRFTDRDGHWVTLEADNGRLLARR